VTRFRENVKAQVNERRVEASQLEGELSGQDMGRLNLEETRRELTSQSQSHSQGQGQGQGPQTRSIKNQTAPTPQQRQDGITAPVPTRSLLGHPPPPAAGVMPSTSPVPVNVAGGTIAGGGVWRPDMGIRFGGALANQPGQAGYPVPRRP